MTCGFRTVLLCAFLCPRTQDRRAARRADTDRRGRRLPAPVAAGRSGHADRRARVPDRGVDARRRTPSPRHRPAGCAARHGISDARSLAERAAADPAWYWAAGMEDLGIPWMRPYDTVVDLSRGVEHPGLLRRRAGSTGPTSRSTAGCARGAAAARAVWWEGDDGATLTLTYAELKARVDARRRRHAGAGRRRRRRGRAAACRWSPRPITTVLAAAKIGADRHAPVQRVRRAGRPGPPGGLRGEAAGDLRRLPPARSAGARSRRSPTRRSATCPA